MKDSEFSKGRRQVGRTVTVRAPAKINLHLEVLRKRHDGFHEIETILQAVSIFDHLRVTLVEEYQGGEPDIEMEAGRPGWSADCEAVVGLGDEGSPNLPLLPGSRATDREAGNVRGRVFT